jgi:hypothetical protein
MHCDSRFDRAAALDLVATLKDQNAVNSYLEGAFETFLSKIPGCGSQAKQPDGWWASLNKAEKRRLSVEHPSFPFLFTEADSELEQWELMLLEDRAQELLNGLQVDFVKKAKLIADVHCLRTTDIHTIVGSSDAEKKVVDFLANFSSGVTLASRKSQIAKELLLLPKLVRSIVDQQTSIDPRIKGANAKLLGRMFGSKRITLKDFDKVYLFVFEGISFFELKEIRQDCARGNHRISIRVISDTICSSMSVLPAVSV